MPRFVRQRTSSGFEYKQRAPTKKPKAEKQPEKQSNGFCYTIQNYNRDDIAFAMSLYEDDDNCKYNIIGFEKGSRKETPHLQGYVYYTNKVSLSRIRKIMEPHHVECQNAAKNVAGYCYCMEDGDYLEQGERPRQGHRTDLEVIKHDILKGKPMSDISKQYFSQWCQYRRSFDEFVNIHKRKDTIVISYENDVNLPQMIKTFYKDHVGTTIHTCTLDESARLWIIAAEGRYDYLLVDKFYLAPCHLASVENLLDYI